MSSEVEFTGRTVELAVAKACQQFDISEEKLNFTIIEKGSAGLFGIVGVKKALIKVKNQEKQTDTVGEAGCGQDTSAAKNPTAERPGRLSTGARIGRETLAKIAGRITAGAQVSTREEDGQVYYDISGGKPGMLIGKRGQTLEAIQYLVEKVVNRNSRERMRVHIDVGGYLAKKKKNLESLAERTAHKAKKSGRPATLGQLNAHDRRIVHLALKDDGDVVTKSVGNGFLRKLVVLPKSRHRGPKRRP